MISKHHQSTPSKQVSKQVSPKSIGATKGTARTPESPPMPLKYSVSGEFIHAFNYKEGTGEEIRGDIEGISTLTSIRKSDVLSIRIAPSTPTSSDCHLSLRDFGSLVERVCVGLWSLIKWREDYPKATKENRKKARRSVLNVIQSLLPFVMQGQYLYFATFTLPPNLENPWEVLDRGLKALSQRKLLRGSTGVLVRELTKEDGPHVHLILCSPTPKLFGSIKRTRRQTGGKVHCKYGYFLGRDGSTRKWPKLSINERITVLERLAFYVSKECLYPSREGAHPRHHDPFHGKSNP